MNRLAVDLTAAEIAEATVVGRKRQQVHDAAGRHDAKVLASGVQTHIDGAIAELVFSKAFGINWSGAFFELPAWEQWRKNGGADVGPYQVRSTRHMHGCLLLHPTDPDAHPFVLVLSGESPRYWVAGWIIAAAGKRTEWWRDVGYGRPCYYVPQSSLSPIQHLARSVNQWP